MSPKRRSTKRPYGAPHPELDPEALRGGVGALRERGPRGEDYWVAVPRPSDKTYTCPGCRQEIPGALAHVVAWPVEHLMGAEAAGAQRRHWHRSCWNTYGRNGG